MSDVEPHGGEVTVRTLVLSAWQTAPPVLRRLALWSWALSLVGVAATISFDMHGFLSDWPFATNLLSQVISAGIALPIALLVVSQLAAYHVEETTRPRLEARVRASRTRMADAIQTLHRHIETVEREATGATNDFVRAVHIEPGDEADAAEIDLAQVNAAAATARSVLDASEWVLFQRLIQPVRLYCSQLHDALIERSRSGESADTLELERLQNELESAVANHSRVIRPRGSGCSAGSRW